MKKIGLILLALYSVNCFAGEWTQPLTIKDVSTSSSEGRFRGNFQLRVTFNELPTTSICNPSEALAVYTTSAPDKWGQIWMSSLLSAQAQNKKVKVFVYSCISNKTPLLHGVKVLRD